MTEFEEIKEVEFNCPMCKHSMIAEVNIKDIAYRYLDDIIEKLRRNNYERARD